MPPRFITSSRDLQTKPQAICDGFLLQALQKNDKAKPFVEEAKKFYTALQSANSIQDLLTLSSFRADLVTACGFSEKAKSQLTSSDLLTAMKRVLEKIFSDSGSDFRVEILYRYLLTKGDTLGGSMRNLTGASASQKLSEKILQTLSSKSKSAQITKSESGKIQKICWQNRLLLFDIKPSIINKNVDVILLNSSSSSTSKTLLNDKSLYLACGELKGGIDPAGADEHWKTANSALSRIREALASNTTLHLFFVGAAIEASMAAEIFRQLETGSLSYAANLTDENQLNDLVSWLVSL